MVKTKQSQEYRLRNAFHRARIVLNCPAAPGRDGEKGQRFLIRELSTKKWIHVCPDCGRGYTEDEKGDTLDEWINPFHSEMVTLFPPSTLEVGIYE